MNSEVRSVEYEASCDGCGEPAKDRCPHCQALTCGECATCEHRREKPQAVSSVQSAPDEARQVLGGAKLERHRKAPHDWNIDLPDGSGCVDVIRIGDDDALACRILDALAAQGRKPALQYLDDGTWLADYRDNNSVITGGNGSTRLAALFDALRRLHE